MNTKLNRMLASVNQHRPHKPRHTATLPVSGFCKIPILSLSICSLRDSELKGGSKITELICQLRKGIKIRGRRRWRTSDFLTTSLVPFLLYPVASKYYKLCSKERFILWYTLYHADSLITLIKN